MGTNIDDKLVVHATCISNDFLDKYMADANGDYIKVYLYMLRHRGEQFTVKDAADALNLTDNDIHRAVHYWEKQGIYADGSGERVKTEIRTEAKLERSEQQLVEAEESEQKARTESEKGGEEAVRDDEEFAGILFVARHVLPALPTRKQVDTLEYMYRELQMNAELIEFLLEYCAGLEKTSSRYMETVAVNWHENGIRTVKQAQQMIREFEESKNRGKKRTKPNRFLNFEQSEVDYDSLAQKKVMDRIQNGAK